MHYDNRGRDENEFVEIGCNQTIDVTGYKIVCYNGNGGEEYSTAILSGVCSPDKFIFKDIPGLQNGGPDGDGIALIDSNAKVIEFISYEGSFEARDGPANGQTSIDIGVSESGTVRTNFSLQLIGTGCNRSDFTWQTQPATILCGNSGISNGELLCIFL